MESSKNFLRVLVEPKPPVPTGIDIVAVHGLNPFKNTSNAISTWTASNGKIWLQDEEFLSTAIPNARIMLFGYNSNVSFTSSNAGLDQQATNLLFLLELERVGCSKRPMIFLCHSLGGILVKRALVRAKLVDKYALIYEATHGIVFFGTPHGGGNNAKVGSLAADIAKFLANREDNSFMEALKKNSFYSEQNKDDFLQIAKDFAYLTFYEANPTKKLILTSQVVDRQNAVLGLDDEREPKIPMDADHSSICKFSDPKEQNYSIVWRSLLEMSKQAAEKTKSAGYSRSTKTEKSPAFPDATSTKDEESYYILPPLAVRNFIERATLMKQLRELLTQRDELASPVVILRGMGGQGKSQLAMKFCETGRLAGEYRAIFWIDTTSENSLARSFGSIIAKISDSMLVPDGMESRITLVKNTIETWRFPWLLVFDNYDRPNEKFNISRCFPQSKYGKIIITSRHSSSERIGKVINVTGMSEDECLELLFSRTRLERNTQNIVEAKSVVARLGNLPLAIDQAGSYISTQNLTMAIFASNYEDRKSHILRYTPLLTEYRKKLNDSDAETALNVFTTLELSLQGIGGPKDSREEIEEFLTLSAFFNNKSFGEDLAITASKISKPGWKYLFMSGDTWDHYKYQDMIANLSNLSLLQSFAPGDIVSFSLHPLVADWLKLRRDAALRQLFTLQSGSALHQILESEDIDTMQLDRTQYILAHLESYLRNRRSFMGSLEYKDQEDHDWLFLFGKFFRRNGRLVEAEEMYQQILQGCEKDLGPEHVLTLNSVLGLGNVYTNQGRLKEAEKMYRRALQGYEKALGPDHESTLNSVHNLGNVYSDQGRVKEAEEMHRRALQGYEKALGPDHKSTLDSVIGLGNIYKGHGKLKEAEEMYRRALQGYEKALGPDHESTLNSVHNLGNVYSDQGRVKEAEEMYRRALQGFEKALGPDHESTLVSVIGLGNIYKGHGKLKEAEEMYRRALQGYEKAFGPDHESTLNSVHNLGNVYSDQGRVKEAEEMYQRVLQGYEKALGPDHESILRPVYNLGLLYSQQGKLKEAEEMYQRALQGYDKALGPDHKSTLDSVIGLGNIYNGHGKLKEAEEMYRRALQGYEKALGPDHETTLKPVYNLGLLYSQQGKLKEAEEMYQRALQGYEKALGQDHKSTLDSVIGLGNIYNGHGKLKEAEEMYRRALQGYEKALGPDHETTLKPVHNLGLLYSQQGKLKAAEEMYRRALQGYEKALGPDHPRTIKVARNLGLLFPSPPRPRKRDRLRDILHF